MLRRPRRRNPDEQRSDPFYEYGSFGCTGCHAANLLNPKRADELNGCRLAFAQGGHLGFRLIMLTPPIHVRNRGPLVEVIWKPRPRPFKYTAAPLLARGHDRIGLDELRTELRGSWRTTAEGKFASAFRSRRRPLRPEVAAALFRLYDDARRTAVEASLADHYWETLPYTPRSPDRNRLRTLRALRENATRARGRSMAIKTACKICRGDR